MINSGLAYSILDIQENIFLSKDGNVTVCYLMINPEPFTLDENKLDNRHEDFLKAFRNLPERVIVHKQDIVTKIKYDSKKHFWRNSFLTSSEKNHFNGREAIEHHCVLTFTLCDLKSLEASYNANPFTYKESLTKHDTERINEFFEAVKNSVSIIGKIYHTTISPFQEDELKYYIINYVNGFHTDNGLRDLEFSNKLTIGDNHFSIFSLSDTSYFPDRITTVVDDRVLKSGKGNLKTGFMDSFGVFFPENHIYNQVFYFDGSEKLKEELENRVESFAKHKSFSPRIESDHRRLKTILEGVINDGNVLCRSHYNIITWSDNPEELKKNEDSIKDILANKEIRFYKPSHEGLENIFFGTIIGRTSKLHPDYYFVNKLETALCLNLNYSYYEDDEEGIVFQDRLLQVPLRKDIWDRKKRRNSARNFIMVAPTGGGKSSAAQNMVYQFLEDDIKLVVAEFGNSFESLTKLYPNRSAHIKYNRETPLGINPFDIGEKELTSDKALSLTAIVMKFWRLPIVDKKNVNVRTAVSKTIVEYYKNKNRKKSFPDYYDFIKENWQTVFKNQEIPEQYFDVESFVHVCSEFLKGGIYENVCSPKGDSENIILNKDFVVFELRQIKNDPFMVSVILSLLDDTVKEKLLSDRSKRGFLIFDEFAETQEMTNSDTGEDVLSTVAFLAQGIRKENGGIGLIYQTLTQMPKDNHYADSIIGNTQILIVLPGNEQVYDNIIDRFHIKNEEHINLMKSIQNDFSNKRPYSEQFIRFNEVYATVVRSEFPLQKYYAFQTEGNEWSELQISYEKTKDLEKSINDLIIKKHG